MAQVGSDLLRSNGPSYLIGPVYFGSALEQTGQVSLFNASSALPTIFQAGNATAAVTYVLPTAGPAANNYLLASSTAGVLSWLNAAGTYAPLSSAFVTIGTDATLPNERSLTGTANQVVVTDNGAGSTVVLSLPQSINTGATVSFATFTATTLLVGKGTATNDNAAAGNIGEHISSLITTATDFPTSTQYGDLTSISLTAGDWDVSIGLISIYVGDVVSQISAGISTTSGNSTSGMNDGDNLMYQAGPLSGVRSSVGVASYRMSLSGTTTVYLKYSSTYTGATPRARGRISARRVR